MDNKYLKDYKGWIPVSVALPDTLEEVLVCVEEDHLVDYSENIGYTDVDIMIGSYYQDEWILLNSDNTCNHDFDIKVKYWMYLPDLPDEYKDSTIEE